MEQNPYLPPVTSPSDIVQAVPPDAEFIRREHLNHENSIKTVGWLWIISGIIFFFSSVITVATLATSRTPDVGSIAVSAVTLMLGAAATILGFAVRRLKTWSRIPAAILAGIGLLGFPVGTLISALILSYILSKKGGMVFSPAYKEIIAVTPHVKARTSWVVWVLLVVCLVILGTLAITLATH